MVFSYYIKFIGTGDKQMNMYFTANDVPAGNGAYVQKIQTKYGYRYKVTGKYFPKKGQWYTEATFQKVKTEWLKEGITEAK